MPRDQRAAKLMAAGNRYLQYTRAQAALAIASRKLREAVVEAVEAGVSKGDMVKTFNRPTWQQIRYWEKRGRIERGL